MDLPVMPCSRALTLPCSHTRCQRITARSLLARCHRCILAARSDYFRALLERATAEAGADGARAAGAREPAGQGPGQAPPLPQAVIGDMGAAAFETVLRFVYTDSIVAAARPGGGGQRGGAAAADPGGSAAAAAEPFAWKEADRAEELLFAADLFLLFSLKVRSRCASRALQCLRWLWLLALSTA
jgi:hypothetical protein